MSRSMDIDRGQRIWLCFLSVFYIFEQEISKISLYGLVAERIMTRKKDGEEIKWLL